MNQRHRHTWTVLDFVPFLPALALAVWLGTIFVAGSPEDRRWSMTVLQAWILLGLIAFGFLRRWPLVGGRPAAPADQDRQVMRFGPRQ